VTSPSPLPANSPSWNRSSSTKACRPPPRD
jgi:hypothetical protein